MEHKPLLLRLFILSLAVSYVLTLGAVPLSRSLTLDNQGTTTIVETVEEMDIGEVSMMEEELTHGRMDIESNDYPGSGANNRHDPRTPGRG